jgi:uncharacterized protein (DUF2237 family)
VPGLLQGRREPATHEPRRAGHQYSHHPSLSLFASLRDSGVHDGSADGDVRAHDLAMDDPAGERNVLGGALEPCGTDPMTGFTRDGCCHTGPEDRGSHTVCVVVSAEFLALQHRLGNDLGTPRPEYGFPGLKPGDRWCVVAARWRQAAEAGAPAGVVLAATNLRALEIVPLELLRAAAVDVPDDLSSLGEQPPGGVG